MKVYYTCPHCEHEIEVYVVINEEDDLPEVHDECGKPIPEDAHDKVNTYAIEKASDVSFYD